MSTDLFGLRVLDVDPTARRLTLRVLVVTLDVAHRRHRRPPLDPSFYLQVLGELGVLDESWDEDALCDEDRIRSEAWRSVAAVEVLRVANHPLQTEADWAERADFHHLRGGRWADEARLPQQDVVVTLRVGHALDGVRPGHAWATASYELQADDVRPAEPLPDLRALLRRPGHAPFDPEEPPRAAVWTQAGLGVLGDLGTLTLLDPDTGEAAWSTQTEGWARRLASWRDRLVTEDPDEGLLEAFSLASGDPLPAPPALAPPVAGWRLRTAGSSLTAHHEDGRSVELRLPDGVAQAAAVLPGGSGVLATTTARSLVRFALPGGGVAQVVPLEASAPQLAVHPGGAFVALSLTPPGPGSALGILRLQSGTWARTAHLASGWVDAPAWSPDGRRLAVLVLSPDEQSGEIKVSAPEA